MGLDEYLRAGIKSRLRISPKKGDAERVIFSDLLLNIFDQGGAGLDEVLFRFGECVGEMALDIKVQTRAFSSRK
jgi:hypothetical protein